MLLKIRVFFTKLCLKHMLHDAMYLIIIFQGIFTVVVSSPKVQITFILCSEAFSHTMRIVLEHLRA